MKQDIHTPEVETKCESTGRLPHLTVSDRASEIAVALLTAGRDKPYAFGMATELIAKGAALDLVGGDDLDCPEFRGKPRVHFLNLRGDQRSNVGFSQKTLRILSYYAKLIRYAAKAKPRIFHILWNNKFLSFDRTLLMLYYKRLGKKIVLTVHNVNAGVRDSNDTHFNQLTLRIQYRLADHIFVHTEQMKRELSTEFGVDGGEASPSSRSASTTLSRTRVLVQPRQSRDWAIQDGKKTILFFGHIAPYKGARILDHCFPTDGVAALPDDCQLIIAGKTEEL